MTIFFCRGAIATAKISRERSAFCQNRGEHASFRLRLLICRRLLRPAVWLWAIAVAPCKPEDKNVADAIGRIHRDKCRTILSEWDAFARSIWPNSASNATIDPAELRDDAEDLLNATVLDMRSDQSIHQRSGKSRGEAAGGVSGARVNKPSESHGKGRVSSGFEMSALVAEYRALRASVLRLWRESLPDPDLLDIDDVTRFNECIDQSLAEAVRSYMDQVKSERQAILDNEQAARRDAETANRAKDMFLATLSHELRTPLNAIVGWVSILRLRGAVGENLAEGLDVIERNTKAQVQLIEDVLDVSRIVSGKLRLEIRECDLIGTINAGIEVVRPTAEARDITLSVQLDPGACRAWCDEVRIQQVIWNLLSNAIKFTHKGGEIRVSLTRERSGMQITVHDNGQGIAPDLLPFIFERFRQADNSTRRVYGGLGLGLSIVKHLTEMHGGTVEAQSEGSGRGSTFIVHLPIKAIHINELEEPSYQADRRQEIAEVIDTLPTRLDGMNIVVVDDEADARRMLTKALESVGAQIITAGNVAEALAIFASAAANGTMPDLVVSDVGMPGLNGYDLIRELRRLGHQPQDLPAIALTAFAHDDDAHEAEQAGFQLHIPKPVNLHDLTAAISRLIMDANDSGHGKPGG